MSKWSAFPTLFFFIYIFLHNTMKIHAMQSYQLTFGNFKVVALLDGYVDLHLQNIVKDASNFNHPYLHVQHPDEVIQIPVNVYLIDTGTQIILVDVGLAGYDNSPTGLLIENVNQAGYQREQITDILITHLHPDHAAGLLTKEGKKAFPNARLHISEKEVQYWIHEQQMYPELTPFIQALIKPYVLQTFTPNQQLFKGISVFSTPGHTPGHSGFLFESDHRKLLIWGDIVHIHELQFEHPAISLKDDTDGQQAIQAREELFKQVSQEAILIGGAHLPFPGLGYVKVTSHAASSVSYFWNPN